jgi:hypothetical protein
LGVICVIHHAQADRKAVPTTDRHHRDDGEVDKFRLGELPAEAAPSMLADGTSSVEFPRISCRGTTRSS